MKYIRQAESEVRIYAEKISKARGQNEKTTDC